MARSISKRVSELLVSVPVEERDEADPKVEGIAYSSRDVKPGDVFFCIPGTAVDGHTFAPDACKRGASALVCERHLDVDVPQFIVADSRRALALAADEAFDHPSRKLRLVGVTGTNGKTTTTYLVEWVLRHCGYTTGLIGTVETRVAGNAHPSSRTTPESLDLQELFADMVDANVTDAVMEVSSHAIDLGRIVGTRFAVTAFSQLTQDHLDYHKTMENYYQAKRRLFFDYEVKRAAICIDDEYGKRLSGELAEAGRDLLTCGFSDSACVRAVDVECGRERTRFSLETPDGTVPMDVPLVGRYNVDNVLLASTICLALGIDAHDIAAALGNSPQVPGRLEKVQAKRALPFSVFVDYAHTPDAIEKATRVIRDITPGRTIIVFGCGGDRDATKRPKMGHAALLADHAIVTSDNPRTEDPDAIIADILPGMVEGRGRFEVIPDREQAIEHAITMAEPGDSVLIAGKGHEDYQLVGDEVRSFDDRLVAKQKMEARQ